MFGKVFPHRPEEPTVKREYAFTAIFEPAEEGGYNVTFPALPGCVTQGDTLEEAREMAADALQLYLQVLRNEGRSIPVERDEGSARPLRERVQVTLAA